MVKNLPNLFIIGASKCGSTYLHNVLNLHDDIWLSEKKELFFFNQKSLSKKDFEEYLAIFRSNISYKYAGESSPIYSETTIFPKIPSRICKLSPEAKIIYLVREPFARLNSVYKQTIFSDHHKKITYYETKMSPDFSESIFNYPPFLEATKYFTHLQNYLKYFSKDQVLVVFFEDLINNEAETLEKIYSFLNLGTSNLNHKAVESNPSDGKMEKTALVNFLSNVTLLKILPKQIKSSFRKALSKKIKVPILKLEVRKRIKTILSPEIEGLYRYLTIKNDPWKFFD